MSEADLSALLLSIKLAGITVVFLLIISVPLALWLSFRQSISSSLVSSLVFLPLVLPPTVLGFYLLVFMKPDSFLGQFVFNITGQQLTFSFTWLVIASMVYSLPFVLQPLIQSFRQIGKRTLYTAKQVGASQWSILKSVILPQSKQGFLNATILGFVHTLGEFGVVLMIGGNIPESTQVVSIQIFNHVENMRLEQANFLSFVLILISFLVIFWINLKSQKSAKRLS